MAKKTKTIAKEVDDVAKLMQELVRLKAADDNGYVECCTCGVVRLWNDRMHGAHFIGRKKLATNGQEKKWQTSNLIFKRRLNSIKPELELSA